MTAPRSGNDGWARRHADARARIIDGTTAPASVVELLENLCRCLTEDLAVSGAAVTLMSRSGSDGVAAASDARTRALDELQFTTGEGPSHESFAARRPALTPDLRNLSHGRWPGYSEAALSAGTAAVFAFPLHVGAAAFGVLGVYRDSPGSMSLDDADAALMFAQIAIEIILDNGLVDIGGDLDAGLSGALDYRAEIHQAQGMVMVDLDVGAIEALSRMRGHSFAHDLSLLALAKDIIAGLRLPDDA